MYFEQCEKPKRTMIRVKTQKMIGMFHEFLESGIEFAEVKGWEEEYKNYNSAYFALRSIAKSNYKDRVYVGRANGRLFLERIDK